MGTNTIYENIKSDYPNMNEQELELEFLTQMWIAAIDNKVIIRRGEQGRSIHYHFSGIHSPAPPPENTEKVDPQRFFSESLSMMMIESIKLRYIYIFDKSGNGDYAIVNAHDEIDVGDLFFNHTMTQQQAIAFIHELASEVD